MPLHRFELDTRYPRDLVAGDADAMVYIAPLFGRRIRENTYAWRNREERDYVGRCLERIDRDPLLRGAVIFDAPGRDMARWYRRVGHLISTSDEEGSHASVAEGMASAAVPVVRRWPGAAYIYGSEWIHDSLAAAAKTVLESADEHIWQRRAQRAQAEIRRSHYPEATVAAWADLLHGDIVGARSYFGEYAKLEAE